MTNGYHSACSRQRGPLVLDLQGQFEQLPLGDFINLGELNIGSPNFILVTASTISVSGTHNVVYATSNQDVNQINVGGSNRVEVSWQG